MAKPKPIPEGFHTVTPHIVVKDGSKAIEFYKKAFGAEEIMRMPGPEGRGVMHAEVKIGDSIVMLCDESPNMDHIKSPSTLKGTTLSLNVYVENADKSFERAVAAGAQVTMPLADMFWGNRYGKVRDPFGHEWGIMTRVEEVSPEECAKRAAAMFSQGPPCDK